jgi:hypothetical protein
LLAAACMTVTTAGALAPSSFPVVMWVPV